VRQVIREVERLRELQLRLSERHPNMERGLTILARLGMLAETAEARAVLMSVSRSSRTTPTGGLHRGGAGGGVREITTMPVRTVLEPLHRAVHLCRQFGKEARLSVVGAELSLTGGCWRLRGRWSTWCETRWTTAWRRRSRAKPPASTAEGSVVIRMEQVATWPSSGLRRRPGLTKRRSPGGRGAGPLGQGEARGLTGVHQLVPPPLPPARRCPRLRRGVGLDVVQSGERPGRAGGGALPGRAGTRFTLTVPMDRARLRC
jgi:hypothetical protein